MDPADAQLEIFARQQAWLREETVKADLGMRAGKRKTRRLRELFMRNEQLGRDVVRYLETQKSE